MSTGKKTALDLLEKPSRRVGFLKSLLPFLGPAFIASVAYIDPGNFATNISAGSKFGYLLVWVVIVSSLMAMLIQTLSAKLGIATGKNLAELCRERLPRWLVWLMWGVMELAAMATDLAEFLGAALGFNLLFGMPMLLGGLLTAVITFLILGLERFGFRPLEAVISALVGVVGLSYLAELVIGHPSWSGIAGSLLQPHFQGSESVLLATGIVGATIMPHVIYLHSALTQNRIVVRDPVKQKKLFHFELADVVIAMTIAMLINTAMLVMAASAFGATGHKDIDSIQVAYKTLEPLLGPAAVIFFGVSLLASGLASSSVGTSAGQIIMQGFLKHRIPVWVRRLVTMIPSITVISLGLDATQTLVASQVFLSFALPFALFPLVIFTANRSVMGPLANRQITNLAAWVITILIVVLNIFLTLQTFGGTS